MEDRNVKRVTQIIVTMAAFLAPFEVSSITVALPTIGREFAMDAISLSWINTAYLLATAVLLLPFGRFADIHGRKKIYTIGLCIFTIVSFLMTICTCSEMLIALRLAQGIGTSMIFSTGMALLTSVFPPNERGKVLGISVTSTYLGLSCGPFVGGFLTQNFGWRSIFLVNIPIGLIALVLILLKLKSEWADAKGEKFDLVGSVLYSAGLAAIMYGISNFSKWGAGFSSGLIIAGICIIIIFIFMEKRIKSPLVNINLFVTNRVFALSNLAAFLNYCATFATTFFLSIYLQYIKQLSPQSAGILMVSQPVIMALFSPFAGRLSDKIEPRIVSSIGMTLSGLSLFMFALLNNDTSLSYILIILIITGIGFALFASPNSNAIMSSVEKKYLGIASGILGTTRMTGQTISMGIAMFILAIFIGNAELIPENFPQLMISIKTAFIFSGFLCLFGILASLSRGKVR
ncbi:MAG: MFS transporter [Spirochaetes bacterium]|nr:MFS transporter [Spirochaetota bacterium]